MASAPKTPHIEDWSAQKSRATYLIEGWGAPYFRVSDGGNVMVRPNPDKDVEIDLCELTEQLRGRGLSFPVLMRFPEILKHRIQLINESFQNAIEEFGYQNRYRGVFPIKVNQQRHLVDELVSAGKEWQFGLEAGSKPELLIALAALKEEGGLIICNGYKDKGFIETALIAQQFSHTVVIVIERPAELEIVLEAAKRLGVRPAIGVRCKLASKGMGRWKDSAGDKAKFGLTAGQILRTVQKLREEDMLDCLRLLHFHIGSQVSAITPWKNALREAGHVYCELVKQGAAMGFLDVGGGLAVDYDGTNSNDAASMNYSVQEYANDVIDGIKEACDANQVAHPTVVSESGRALISYQSILLFEVLGESVERQLPHAPGDDAGRAWKDLWYTHEHITTDNIRESWHDSQQALSEARTAFRLGYVGLDELAGVEALFWSCCEKIESAARTRDDVDDEIAALQNIASSIYYCNFSLFQSAPDIWAMDQQFPIMPIHRLNERPTVKARLADLTCDSDGMISCFIGEDEASPVLDLHPIYDGEPYILGMFLVGAYQEILGDLHNLFGDTHAVHIRTDEDDFEIEEIIKGDTIGDVLRYVQYDPKDMIDRVRKRAESNHRKGRITLEQLRAFMGHYEDAMRGYTYLDP